MPTPRRSRYPLAGLVVVALAAVGYAGWRWNHQRAERAEALELALTRARRLALVGRFDEADAEAARLLAAKPGDPSLTYLRAEILSQAGARDRAAALLDPLVARAYTPAVVLRGVLYAEADPPDPDRAIPLLRRGLDGPARAPERNLARYHLAQMLFRAGQADEARQALEAHRAG